MGAERDILQGRHGGNRRTCWNVRPMPSRATRRAAARRCAALEADFAARHARDAGDEIENRALAAPFGPIRPRISPAFMVKSTSLTATRPPNCLRTARTSSRPTRCGITRRGNGSAPACRCAGGDAGGAREPAAGETARARRGRVCSSTISRMPKAMVSKFLRRRAAWATRSADCPG